MTHAVHHRAQENVRSTDAAGRPRGDPARRESLVAVLGIGCFVVVADQLVKSLAVGTLTPGLPVPIVEGFVSLTLGLNTGLAFGLLRGLGSGAWWLMLTFSAGALVVLARLALTMLPHGGRLLAAAFGLVFGGAVGNLVDRARVGAVIDFIDLSWGAYHWPAFNTADAAICVGVVALMGHFLAGPPPPRVEGGSSGPSKEELE